MQSLHTSFDLGRFVHMVAGNSPEQPVSNGSGKTGVSVAMEHVNVSQRSHLPFFARAVPSFHHLYIVGSPWRVAAECADGTPARYATLRQ